MAADIKVEINEAGVRELLRSDEVLADLQRRGERIASAAGEGFVAETWKGRNRDRVTVRTGDEVARRAEAVSRVLTGAIDAGR